MIEVRCKGIKGNAPCNKLLAMAKLMDAAIQCPSCHTLFEYHIYNNRFVTSQYDPTEERVLRTEPISDNIQIES